MATESGAKIGIFLKSNGCREGFFWLEPDWLTKAAGLKLHHRGRDSPAAFGRQAALRID